MSIQSEHDQDRHRTEAKRRDSHLQGRGIGDITLVQRAAVIITVLGEAAAKPIVERLDDVALSKVADALEAIRFIPREDLAEITIDFLTNLRKAAGALRGGKLKAREVIAGVVEPQRLRLILNEPELGNASQASQQESVWGQLEKRPPQQVAKYLNGLTPNIIALILRKLDVSISSDILCHLDDQKLAPMMGYMVEAGTADQGIDAVVMRMLEMEFLNVQQQESEEDLEHLEAIGELLSLIPADRRESLVTFLHNEHGAKLKSIENAIFTIEGLPEMLPRAAVAVVFREMGADTMLDLLASLQSKHAQVADFLLTNISARMADQIRDDMKDVKTVPADIAETLQRNFLVSLMGMKRRDLIVLEKPPVVEE